MTLGTRLWLVIALFLLSITCLLIPYLKNDVKSITAIDVQISANRFQRPLRKLLEYLPQHDVKTYRILTGDKAAKEGLSTLQAQITEQFRQLNAYFETYRNTVGGRLLGIGQNFIINPRSPPNLFKKWEELRDRSLDLTPAGSLSAHHLLIRDLKSLITLLGDTSRLIVVNRLENFYAMETTMVDLPEIQENLNSIVLIGDEALYKNQISEKMREDILVNLALLQLTLESSEARIGRAFKADTTQGQNTDLSQLYTNYTNEINDFIIYTKEKVLQGTPSPEVLKEFLSKASDAQEAAFLFWDLAIDRLDEALNRDKRSIWLSLLAVLGVSLGAAILAIILAIPIIKSLGKVGEIDKKNMSLTQIVADANAISSSNRENLGLLENHTKEILEGCKIIGSKLSILGEKVEGITTVASNISKVADQTNLLSLNASIEAEKAGEFGKSFSVIAREIRRLADLISNAASDIQKVSGEMLGAVSTSQEGVQGFSHEIRRHADEIEKINHQLDILIAETKNT